MPRIQMKELITKDPVGLNYLTEISGYNPILESHLHKVFIKIKKSNLVSVLEYGFREYSLLYEECCTLKEVHKQSKRRAFLRLNLLDVLYLNGIYTFWNCFINNGALEDFFIKEFNKKGLDVINSLSKLSQGYMESIFSNPTINLKITKKEIDFEFNKKSKGKYILEGDLDKCYFYFLFLQKLFSKFNEKEFFPLFKKISKSLELPNYAPETYKTLIKDYKKVYSYNLYPGVIHVNNKICDFNKNKLYELDYKLNVTLKKLLRKNTLSLLSPMFFELKYLCDKKLISRYGLNEKIKNKYDSQNSFSGTLHMELSQACNFNCTHCFNRGQTRGKKLSFADYKVIIDWFADQGNFYAVLFGGEPLLNPDFVEIVKYLHKKKFKIEVFTNACLLTSRILEKIKTVPIYRYRISLEGSKEVNDKIRGQGSFEKTLKGIQTLKKHSVAPVHLSVTLSVDNKNEIENLFKIAKTENIDGLGFGLLVPIGKSKFSKKMLFPAEAFEANDKIKRLSIKHGIKAGMAHFCENPVNEAKNKNKYIMSSPCGIGYNMFYVREDGYIVPCPELTEKKWGTHFSKLSKNITVHSLFCKEIKALKYVTEPCRNCGQFFVCFGSCKAKIYQLYGSFLKCDLYEKNRNKYLFSKIGGQHGIKRNNSK